MKIISHRGNIQGPNESEENKPEYIFAAIKAGFDVEVDIWVENKAIFLGHDKPTYRINLDFLRSDKLWCHCKNISALYLLRQNNIRCFFHDVDAAVLTSDGFLWTYPGKQLTPISIAVMPERVTDWAISNCFGICTDYPKYYKFV